MIRILLADDHLLFRTMLEEMIKKDSELKVIASCSNGVEVIKFCEKVTPDIVLLDIGMPEKNGIEVLKELKEKSSDIKVVMLTTFEDDENINMAIQLGADGYFIKDMRPDTLILSLKCIDQNMVIFHKGAYKLLQNAVCDSRGLIQKKVQINDMIFDATDLRILQLIVQGRTNKEIGMIMNYSEGTIKNKISKLLSMTRFSDRTELSVFAINQSLV